MTNSEFNTEFDIYYNSICSNQAPSLDAYEKSVLLTMAQEALVREYYSGVNTSFEYTEEVRRALDGIVKFIDIEPYGRQTNGLVLKPIKGTIYKLPENLWFITYEAVKVEDKNNPCHKDLILSVTPTTQDEYNRVKNNPFRGANRRQALRLDIGNSRVNLIHNYKLGTYTIGYIEELSPIILENLGGDDLSINGISKATECKLNSATHRIILQKAVEAARAIYLSNTQQ